MKRWDGVLGSERFDLSRCHVVCGGLPFLAKGGKGLVSLVDLLNNGRREATGIFTGVGHIDVWVVGVGMANSHRGLDISESSMRISSAQDSSGQKGRHELSSSITLPDYARNDTSGGILGVQRVTQLLSDGVVLLLHRESLEHERVPFVLEGLQQSRDRRMARGTWRSGAWAFPRRLVPIRTRIFDKDTYWL